MQLHHLDLHTRADAEALADQLRARIRAGLFDTPAETAGETAARDGTLTFRAFAAEWSLRRGYQLVRARDNDYRLKLVYDFALPGTSLAVKFGDKRAANITTGDIESTGIIGASKASRR